MRSIVDYYAHHDDTDITRKYVGLLPWNLEETEVIKEAMKSQKKTEKIDKKKDKKAKEKKRYGKEDTAFCYNKRPTLLKEQMGDSLTSLDISQDGSSGSLDASSSSLDASSSNWNQDHTQYHRVSAEQVRTITEEHTRRREERRRKREAAKKNSMPEVDMPDKKTADEDNRRHRAFLWYARMDSPARTEFKRKVAATESSSSSIDITPEDIDLLPWNLTGRLVNISKMNDITRASILKKEHDISCQRPDENV
jgi:(2Fe-2S) ferredoxin